MIEESPNARLTSLDSTALVFHDCLVNLGCVFISRNKSTVPRGTYPASQSDGLPASGGASRCHLELDPGHRGWEEAEEGLPPPGQ